LSITDEVQIPAQCSDATELHKRINLIVDMIPEEFADKKDIVRKLIGRRNSIPFTAPAVIWVRWDEVASILSSDLPDPKSGSWAEEIATLFRE